jgi:hypothetical protein
MSRWPPRPLLLIFPSEGRAVDLAATVPVEAQEVAGSVLAVRDFLALCSD